MNDYLHGQCLASTDYVSLVLLVPHNCHATTFAYIMIAEKLASILSIVIIINEYNYCAIAVIITINSDSHGIMLTAAHTPVLRS